MRHLDVAERRRRLIVRHHLDRPAATVEQVAADLVGLHSTDPATVVLALRARLDPFDVAHLEDALYERRSLLRLLAMRRTMFVVPLDLAAVMQASCAAALAPVERRKLVDLLDGAGVADDVDAWIARVEATVAGRRGDRGPTPASQLTKLVPDLARQLRIAIGKPYEGNDRGLDTGALPDVDRGHVGPGPAARVVDLQPVPVGADGRLDRRAPGARRRDGAGRARPALAAGLRTGHARRSGLVDEVDEGSGRAALAAVEAVEITTEWRCHQGAGVALPDDLDDTAVPAAAPVNLLPALDSTIMGWKERAGTSAPIVVRCSTAAATPDPPCGSAAAVGAWSQRIGGEVVTRMLELARRSARSRIDAEAARLTEWMDGVRVTPRFPTALDRELANS